MSFAQIEFAYFLPIAFGVWLLVRRNYRAAVAWLLVASLVFYGLNHWWMLPIIIAYCLIDWSTGLWLKHTSHPRFVLALGVGFNLLMLCFWKYTPLLLETIAELTGCCAVPLKALTPGIGSCRWASRSTRLPASPTWSTSIAVRYPLRPVCGDTRYLPRSSRTWLPDPSCGRANFSRPAARRDADAPARPRRKETFLIARGFFKKLVLADSIAPASIHSSRMSRTRRPREFGRCPTSISTHSRSISTSPAIPTSPAGLACCSDFAGRRTSTGPIWRRRAQRLLAPLAHDVVALSARLSLHPARRQPRRAVARTRA